jgi:hypothetical protein
MEAADEVTAVAEAADQKDLKRISRCPGLARLRDSGRRSKG